MKRFYKTAALVSLLGISNVSCGAARDARAIHETEGIGQAIHPMERVRELWKNGKNCFKEHPVGCVVGVVGGVVGIGLTIWGFVYLYRWLSNRAAPVEQEVPAEEGKAPAVEEEEKGEEAPVPAVEEEKGEEAPVSEQEVPVAAPVEQDTVEEVNDFFEAVKIGNYEKVEELISNNDTLVKVLDEFEWTALHIAAGNGHTQVVDLLIQRGASIDATKNGITPLHVAAGNGCTKVVNLLIQKGASINARENEGRTPLYFATYKKRVKVIRVLLKADADRNVKNNKGENLLDRANDKIRELFAS
ncbi:MAG: ankyrin repeat domain-containing protein [Holosporales bacterium]|jgi:hypothetical protein|nr:ankyrin repeat domain-containing protein [Holosporales bacterium]